MILILVYAILVHIVTERAKVLDDIHDSIKISKAVVYHIRESAYTRIPLVIAKASVRSGGRRIAKPPQPDPLFELFDHEIDKCVASA